MKRASWSAKYLASALAQMACPGVWQKLHGTMRTCFGEPKLHGSKSQISQASQKIGMASIGSNQTPEVSPTIKFTFKVNYIGVATTSNPSQVHKFSYFLDCH